MFLVAACGARARPNALPMRPSSADGTPAEAAARAGDRPADAAPELHDTERAAIDEWHRMSDPDLHYGARPQARPPHWKPFRHDGAFSFDRVASIRAYPFRTGLFDEIEQTTHCHDILARDGTFCPSVAFPGILLSDAQRDGLIALVNDVLHPRQRPPSFRCTFDPHHGFVFFDREGTPIAEIQVCFDCGQWSVSFASGSTQMGDGEVGLRKLCEVLGLGDCWFGTEHGPNLTSLFDRGLIEDPYPAIADFGIDPALVEASASPAQKEILCRWAQTGIVLWQRNVLPWRIEPTDSYERGTYGFEFPEGAGQELHVIVDDTASCVAKFPKCNVPIGAVERCYRARYPRGQLLKDGVVFPASPPEACDAARGCMWGVEETLVAVP